MAQQPKRPTLRACGSRRCGLTDQGTGPRGEIDKPLAQNKVAQGAALLPAVSGGPQVLLSEGRCPRVGPPPEHPGWGSPWSAAPRKPSFGRPTSLQHRPPTAIPRGCVYQLLCSLRRFWAPAEPHGVGLLLRTPMTGAPAGFWPGSPSPLHSPLFTCPGFLGWSGVGGVGQPRRGRVL